MYASWLAVNHVAIHLHGMEVLIQRVMLSSSCSAGIWEEHSERKAQDGKVSFRQGFALSRPEEEVGNSSAQVGFNWPEEEKWRVGVGARFLGVMPEEGMFIPGAAGKEQENVRLAKCSRRSFCRSVCRACE